MTFTRIEFLDSLGLADRLESARGTELLSPWGIARLIRREVRRKAIVTRRELRHIIEPYLLASSFDGDSKHLIQAVADRMVEVGELADLKVENQRGYSAMPSRWIKLDEHDAVLLGTTATETHRFSSYHPNQFLRRFRPSDNIVSDLSRIGVVEQAFDDWIGAPEWDQFAKSSTTIENLDGLLEWHVSRLDNEGSPLRLEETNVLAVDRRPGDFFGSERVSNNSRWVACSRLDDGIYIGAQPGHNENHWIPLLVRIQGESSRTLELHCRNDAAANIDLRNWLLIALGIRYQHEEIIVLDKETSEVRCTFPVPFAIRKLLCLIGEPTGQWQRYTVLNLATAGTLLSRCVPEVCVQYDLHR